jgi:hypothetical protein
MIPKVCHVVTFKEPVTSKNITEGGSVDNNLHAHLNPMRVQPEEEKYDIESNNPENMDPRYENFIATVKNNMCCCTRKQLFEYIIVSTITAIFLVALIYIIYIIKN